MEGKMYKNNYFEIEMGQDFLFNYIIDENLQISIQMPSFEIDNENVVPTQKFIYKERNKLNENIEEIISKRVSRLNKKNNRDDLGYEITRNEKNSRRKSNYQII